MTGTFYLFRYVFFCFFALVYKFLKCISLSSLYFVYYKNNGTIAIFKDFTFWALIIAPIWFFKQWCGFEVILINLIKTLIKLKHLIISLLYYIFSINVIY